GRKPGPVDRSRRPARIVAGTKLRHGRQANKGPQQSLSGGMGGARRQVAAGIVGLHRHSAREQNSVTADSFRCPAGLYDGGGTLYKVDWMPVHNKETLV